MAAMKWNIQKLSVELKKFGLIVDETTFVDGECDAPIMRQVALLVEAVGDGGLKLTKTGNLPTKVVESIAVCCPSAREKRFLKLSKRFVEHEQKAAQRARILCDIAKIVKVSKGKMLRGSNYKVFDSLGPCEKYLFLLMHYFSLNFAYFDGAEEEDMTHNIAGALLHIVRDAPKMYRNTEVYLAFLYDALPDVADDVEMLIEPGFRGNAFDTFVFLSEMRLMNNFFEPFGLVEQKEKESYVEPEEYAKTPLLNRLLISAEAVDEKLIMSGQLARNFLKKAKDEFGENDLFYDVMYMLVQMSDGYLFDSEEVAKSIVRGKRVIGTKAERFEEFYRELGASVMHTFRHFTRLEVRGGGNRDMMGEFHGFVDGLYLILDQDRPFSLFQNMTAVMYHLKEQLLVVHDIDITTEGFDVEIEEEFGKETIEDIAILLSLMNSLEKTCKKSKRITSKIKKESTEMLFHFVLMIMEMYTVKLEKEML